jgi:1,4-dihydroxy-2-naphthoate octaprenyltransferase
MTVGLMYALYLGHVWAKRLLLVLLCLASVVVAAGFLRTHSLPLATVLLFNLVCFVLLKSKQVKAFMLYQKTRKERRDA